MFDGNFYLKLLNLKKKKTKMTIAFCYCTMCLLVILLNKIPNDKIQCMAENPYADTDGTDGTDPLPTL